MMFIYIYIYGNRILTAPYPLSFLGISFEVKIVWWIGLNLFSNLILPKVSIFGWTLFKNIIPFDANLQLKNISLVSSGVYSIEHPLEDYDHVLIRSNLAISGLGEILSYFNIEDMLVLLFLFLH